MLKKLLCFIMGCVILGISISANIYAEDEVLYGNHDLLINELLDKGFETDRLIAVRTTRDEIPLLSEYLMNKNVTKYLDPTLVDGFDSKDVAQEFLLNGFGEENVYKFTFKLKDSLIPIGQISYTYNSGVLSMSYFIASEYQRCGYTSEVALPLTREIFESSSDVNFVYISCDYRNVSSAKLAEKICKFITKDIDKYSYVKEFRECSAEFQGREIEFKYYEFLLSRCI